MAVIEGQLPLARVARMVRQPLSQDFVALLADGDPDLLSLDFYSSADSPLQNGKRGKTRSILTRMDELPYVYLIRARLLWSRHNLRDIVFRITPNHVQVPSFSLTLLDTVQHV